MTEDYFQSIIRLLGSEHLLVQNISSAELQHISSRSFRNNLYTHTVSIEDSQAWQAVGDSCKLCEEATWVDKLLDKVQLDDCQIINNKLEIEEVYPQTHTIIYIL